jgi:hypothetical protein
MAVHKKPSVAVSVKSVKTVASAKAKTAKLKAKHLKVASPNHEQLTLEEKMAMFAEKACICLFCCGFVV